MDNLIGDYTDFLSEDDAPETPAPLFAFNAFKHAIFGTPKVEQVARRPRRRDLRQSNREARNAMQHRGTATPAMASPAKGILMTPRTAGGTRKTVSFGNAPRIGQLNFAETSTNQTTTRDNNAEWQVEVDTKGRTNRGQDTKVSSLEPGSQPLSAENDDLSQRFERLSTKAKPADNTTRRDQVSSWQANETYWEDQYRSYSAKSEQEMRKFLEREKLAKSFAKHRDEDALRLEDDLKKERRRTRELEEELRRLTRASTNKEEDEDFQSQLKNLKHENATLRAKLEEGKKRDPGDRDASKTHRIGRTPPKSDRRISAARLSSRRANKEVMTSDLWVGAGFEYVAPVKDKPRRRLSSRAREPLAEAAGNETVPRLTRAVSLNLENENSVVVKDGTEPSFFAVKERGPTRPSGLTEERKAAALQRLEERRKAREGKAR